MKNVIMLFCILGLIFFPKLITENTSTKDTRPQSTRMASTSQTPTTTANSVGTPIPSYVYENTLNSDKFANIINADKKVIFFADVECNMGRAKKNFIQQTLSEKNLNEYYEYIPNLNPRGAMMVYCKNRTNKCAQIFLFDNCSDGVCIINPAQKRYYKLENYTSIGSVAESLKNW